MSDQLTSEQKAIYTERTRCFKIVQVQVDILSKALGQARGCSRSEVQSNLRHELEKWLAVGEAIRRPGEPT